MATVPNDLDLDCFACEGAEISTPPPAPPTKSAKAKAKRPAKARAARGGGGRSKGGDSAAAAAAPEAGEDGCVEVDVDAEEEETETPAKKPRTQPRHRQAEEKEGEDGRVQVEVLCTVCRKSKTTTRQASLAGFFNRVGARPVVDAVDVEKALDAGGGGDGGDGGSSSGGGSASSSTQPTPIAPCAPSAPPGGPAVFSHGAAKEGEGSAQMLFCSRCLAPMHDQRYRSIDPESRGAGASRAGCPLAAALKRYKQGAVQTSAKWELTDTQALALMREPCMLCGVLPDLVRGSPNGITRLRNNGGERSMGPYSVNNTATACSACNMMKGCHTVEGIREICRTISSHREGGDFGLFPERFVDNTSKRSRSAYLADHKTHALTNAQFNKMVEQPCHYCGKQHEKGKHYNGLDRLDNSVRVYTESTCVSCCGTCNMAKGRHSEALFLQKCKDIAEKAVATPSAADGLEEVTTGLAEDIGERAAGSSDDCDAAIPV